MKLRTWESILLILLFVLLLLTNYYFYISIPTHIQIFSNINDNCDNNFIYVEHNTLSKELEWELAMSRLDWGIVDNAVTKKTDLPEEWVSKYLDLVYPLLEEVPGPLINISRAPIDVDCGRSDYSHFLTGYARKKPVKVYDLTEMAYELDILEIRLFELESVVDEFALLEGLYTHLGLKKPLFYQRNSKRYSRWKDRVKYFVWDERMILDSDRLNGKTPKIDWSLENKSRYYLFYAFLEYHNDGKDFNDEDIFILGDLDEIPSSEVIAHLKYCEIKKNFLPAKFSAVFWRFSFHWMVTTKGACEFPIIATWKNLNVENPPLRERKFLNTFGRQAWHLNRFGPAIMQVVKEFSIAEGGLRMPMNDVNILRNLTFIKEKMENGYRPCCPGEKIPHIDNPIEKGYAIPWIILENQNSTRWNFL